MTRVLVTGGAGFIGRHVVQRLVDQGADVVTADDYSTGLREPLRAIPGVVDLDHDVRRPLHLTGLDRIIHLACPASPPAYQADPLGTLRTCVVGTLNMLDLAGENGASLTMTSTSEVYGDPAVTPQPETYRGSVNPVGPRACYDEGKRAAETVLYEGRRAGVDTKIARLFNTYGPGMRRDDGRVVTNLIAQALAGEPLTIYGDGTQTRSFCYVDDTVDGLLRLSRSQEAGPMNIGNPHEVTVAGLALLIADLVGGKHRLDYRPLPVDDPTRRCPDITYARRALGWSPSTPLADGIRRTIDAMREGDAAVHRRNPVPGASGSTDPVRA